MSGSNEAKWQRVRDGYLRSDEGWFLERGVRMNVGGTNGWLIYRLVDEANIGRDSGNAYDQRNGRSLFRITPEGSTTTAPHDHRGPLYAHEYDAGSFAEAKATVAHIEESAA